MTASVAGLLRRLRESGVDLRVDGEALRYDAPVGALTPELLGELRTHKAAVVAALESSVATQRVTHYIPVRDDVRLMADVFRPRRDERAVMDPMPAIWCHERYNIADYDDGESRLDTAPWLRKVMAAGYVVVSVHARGTGGSTGRRLSEFTPAEQTDSYDITEWIASQPFCDGNVGMFGDSFLGIAQFIAASAAPPHLKAIFPGVALYDLYAFLRSGGVYRHDFAHHWSEMVKMLDSGRPGHAGIFDLTQGLEFRDSTGPAGARPYQEQSPSSFADAINRSGVPIHHLSGWYDLWVRDALSWFTTLDNPQRLLIGPWCHNDRTGIDIADEHIRWFDRWLKDIRNGVDEEPPIRYFTMGAPPGAEWRTADKWPLPETIVHTMYLDPNGLGLTRSAPDGPAADHVPGWNTTSGRTSRWSNGYHTYSFGADRFGYDLTINDQNSLTFSSAPLPRPLEVTGHPVLSLLIGSTHTDGDFFAYLQDIDPSGKARYVTEGVLRASHRAIDEEAMSPLGIPVHPHTAGSAAPLTADPDRPSRLLFDLHPTSYVFAPGHCIRISIACCDLDNARTPKISPPPLVRLHSRPGAESWIDLPVIPDAGREGTAR